MMMKKWVDDNLGWILTIALVIVIIVVAGFMWDMVCMDCDPTNITEVWNGAL